MADKEEKTKAELTKIAHDARKVVHAKRLKKRDENVEKVKKEHK